MYTIDSVELRIRVVTSHYLLTKPVGTGTGGGQFSLCFGGTCFTAFNSLRVSDAQAQATVQLAKVDRDRFSLTAWTLIAIPSSLSTDVIN